MDEASRFFRQGGFSREVTQCVLLRTRALRQMGRFEEALESARAQIKAVGPDVDKAQLADLEDAIASTLAVLERYPDALSSYQNVERVNRGLGDKVGVGFALSALARISWRLGDFESAQRYLREAGGIAGTSDRGLQSLIATVSNVDAEIELARAQNSVAAAKAKRAIEIALAGKQKRNAIESGLTLAQAQARSGAGRSSLLIAREAVTLADEYAEYYLKLRARAVLAESALAAGDAATARDTAAEVAAAFTSAGQLDSGWRAQVVLADALRRLGARGQADDAERQARALLERMRAFWPADKFARYLARPDLAVGPYQRFTAKETGHVQSQAQFPLAMSGAGGLRSLPDGLPTWTRWRGRQAYHNGGGLVQGFLVRKIGGQRQRLRSGRWPFQTLQERGC